MVFDKKIALVILNWNGEKLLEKFLPSVLEYSKNVDIVIADNGSSDNSISYIKDNYPEIRIIKNHGNLGFTGGYNKALKQVNADFYILLNSDVEVTENWINPIIELMQQDDKIAVCQPKILSYVEKDKFEYARASGGFIDYLGYPFCRGRIFQNLEKDNSQYDNPIEIFWATGAAMFVKADIYHKFGGLDEDFFAHQEEIDFCWRVKNAGYKVYCNPKSVIYHLGGGTLNKTSPKKTYLNFRNNLFLLYKNLPQDKLKKILLMRFFLDIIASVMFLLKGSFGEFKAVYMAYIDFVKMKSKMKQKRQEIRLKDLSGVYNKSIVIDNYLRKKIKFSDLKF